MLDLLLAAALAAQPALTPVEAAVLACAAKPEPERLACYDAVAARVSDGVLSGLAPAPASARPEPAMAAEESEAAPEPRAAEAPAPATARAEPAPARAAPTPPPREADRTRTGTEEDGGFEAAITRVTFDAYEDAVITLANGEVWRQLRADRRKLRARDAESAQRAVVKPGALGSYRMTVEPSGRTLKVRKVE